MHFKRGFYQKVIKLSKQWAILKGGYSEFQVKNKVCFRFIYCCLGNSVPFHFLRHKFTLVLQTFAAYSRGRFSTSKRGLW